MLENGSHDVCLVRGEVFRSITKHYVLEGLNWLVVRTCWDTAIDETLLIKVLIGEIKRGSVSQVVLEYRVYAKAITVIEITVILQILGEQINPECGVIAEV